MMTHCSPTVLLAEIARRDSSVRVEVRDGCITIDESTPLRGKVIVDYSPGGLHAFISNAMWYQAERHPALSPNALAVSDAVKV